jgi:ATP-binding cassette subfamily B protein
MRKAFLFLSHYLKAFRLQILISLISIIMISLSILGLGYALKYLIDQGFTAHSEQSLNHAFMLLIVMVVLLSFASYSRSFSMNWISERLEAAIKKDAFVNVIKISPSYFELNKVSDITSRLTTDLSLVVNIITMIASYSIRNILTALGGLIMLMLGSFKLTSYVLIALPIVIIPIIIVGRRIRKLSKSNQDNISNYNAVMEENFSFIKAVQAYNNEEFEINKFNRIINNSLNLAKHRIKLRSLFFAIAIGLILAAIAFVLWIGGHDVLAGKMTAGALSSFVFYAVITATSLGALSEAYSDIQRGVGALERVIEVVHAKSDIVESSSQFKLKQTASIDLSVENLSFTYPSRKEAKILDNINFAIKGNTTVALVGPSGAGKSTIFQLLLRFYDPNEGVIKLNGINIKDLSLNDLRKNFAFVSQDPIIFSASAYDNILYGNVNASSEEVEAAAKAAEIFDFFNSLPEGLNTYLGERGVKISGGQKQRIAIARAILRNPKILLLDEATSALDNENEKLVQLALTNLRENRTTLVIAHRISTIVDADSIILLDQGKIIAQGTHQELLKSSELYNKLCSNSIFHS